MPRAAHLIESRCFESEVSIKMFWEVAAENDVSALSSGEFDNPGDNVLGLFAALAPVVPDLL